MKEVHFFRTEAEFQDWFKSKLNASYARQATNYSLEVVPPTPEASSSSESEPSNPLAICAPDGGGSVADAEPANPDGNNPDASNASIPSLQSGNPSDDGLVTFHGITYRAKSVSFFDWVDDGKEVRF